jgi:HAD superfamily hydrolase (TIGR01509 family)
MAFPELIIFDCDGVLVDSEMIANRLLAEHLTKYHFPITTGGCKDRFIGYSIVKIIAEVRSEGVDLPNDFEPFLKQSDQVAFAAELEAISGVANTLSKLTQNKCVASSGALDKTQKNLALTGLIDFFEPDHLFSANMVKKPKPAPDLFLHAAKHFDADPKNCLVIEDTTLGIQAGLAAGMTVFGFAGGSHCDEAYVARLKKTDIKTVFNQMNELPTFIANLVLTV